MRVLPIAYVPRFPRLLRPGVKVALDDEPVVVSLDDMVVYCETESLKHRVERLVAMVRSASTPIVDDFHLTPACSSMLFQGKHNQVKLEQKRYEGYTPHANYTLVL